MPEYLKNSTFSLNIKFLQCQYVPRLCILSTYICGFNNTSCICITHVQMSSSSLRCDLIQMKSTFEELRINTAVFVLTFVCSLSSV